MEVIDLGLKDVEPISLHLNDNEYKPSVNFGPGIELLMNEKKKNSYSNTNVDMGDLDKLEQDLNDLSQGGGGDGGGGGGGENSFSKSLNFGNWFGGGNNASASSDSGIRLNVEEMGDSNLGEATAQSVSGFTRTADGFGKLNTEIPLEHSSSARMTDREKRRKKRMMIKKLEEWYEKGIIKHSSHFNLESNYEEIEDEYEGALEDKRKKDSIKMQGWWFMTLVNSVEYANASFNPFDLNLDGWGEQVSEDLDSYEEIFGELYHKYKGGKLSPEISILLRLGFSAAVVNFTNKALSSATPAFNDVIKQSPELMKMFTNATVQSMSQASPGFNMANNMMNRDPEVSTTFGPPPAAVATKNQPPPQRNPMSNMQFTRPDLSAGRGDTTPMFREQGIDLQERSYVSQAPAPQKRPEMRGPQNMDLNQILSGLKTRDTALEEPQPPQPQQQQVNNFFGEQSSMQSQIQELNISPPAGSSTLNENDSMISISSLRDMQNASIPKRVRRKQRSDRNTISLDI